MGNLHSERGIGILNPPDQPYLHIVPSIPTKEGMPPYRYKDSLMGMDIFVVSSLPKNDSVMVKDAYLAKIPIALTPLLEEVPPKPIFVAEHIKMVIDRNMDMILENIPPNATGLILNHG